MNGQRAASGGRILLRHFDGIVPSGFSSNSLDNATHQRVSNITRWNIHRGSAGLRPSYFGDAYFPAVLG
jgi:hypothetical protein